MAGCLFIYFLSFAFLSLQQGQPVPFTLSPLRFHPLSSPPCLFLPLAFVREARDKCL